MSDVQKYRSELAALVALGEKMKSDTILRRGEAKDVMQEEAMNLEDNYQQWYTEAFLIIKQLLPDRLTEFQHLYMRDRVGSIFFSIQDWLNGFRGDSDRYEEEGSSTFRYVAMSFRTQLGILKSVEARLESTLSNIRQLEQADLFDSELDSARELASRGFLRAAGVVAGVVLERHLSQVVDNHNIRTRKRNPTISDFDELLKNDGVLDIPSWRQIQRLADIRNFCAHNKKREPTGEEVEELINGVEKYTKTLF